MKKYTVKEIKEGNFLLFIDSEETYAKLENVGGLISKDISKDVIGHLYSTHNRSYSSNSSRYSLGGYSCSHLLNDILTINDIDFEDTYPRLMEVSYNSDFTKSKNRIVLARNSKGYIAGSYAENIEDVDNSSGIIIWAYAREISEFIFPFTLKPKDATRIIEIACDSWKAKLADKWALNIVLNKDTIISEEEYNEMYAACTYSQKELFNDIFK